MNSLSNIKKLRMAYLFVNMMFMIGFISPYFIDRGLSATTIMYSQSFYMGITLLLEVPSGIIGDKYGQKLCLLISGVSALLGWSSVLGIQFSANFSWQSSLCLFLYQFFFGVFSAFLSGALEGYLYSYLEKRGKAEHYKEELMHLQGKKYQAMIVSGVVGTFFYQWGGYAFLLGITMLMSALGLVFLVRTDNLRESGSHPDKEVKHPVRESLRILAGRKVIFAVSDGLLNGAVMASFFHLHQIWLKAEGFPVLWNGLYTTVIFLSSIAAMKLYRAKFQQQEETKMVIVLNICMTVPLFALFFPHHPYIVAICWIALFSVHFMRGILSNVLLNRYMASEVRTTGLSMVSLLKNIGGMMTAPFFGWLFRTEKGELILGICLVAIAFSTFFMSRQRRNESMP